MKKEAQITCSANNLFDTCRNVIGNQKFNKIWERRKKKNYRQENRYLQITNIDMFTIELYQVQQCPEFLDLHFPFFSGLLKISPLPFEWSDFHSQQRSMCGFNHLLPLLHLLLRLLWRQFPPFLRTLEPPYSWHGRLRMKLMLLVSLVVTSKLSGRSYMLRFLSDRFSQSALICASRGH